MTKIKNIKKNLKFHKIKFVVRIIKYDAGDSNETFEQGIDLPSVKLFGGKYWKKFIAIFMNC